MGGLAVVLGLLLLVAWFAGIGTHRMMTLPRPFSSQLWKEAAEGAADGSNIDRCRMAFDLRTRIGLVGKNEAEIIKLLGDERESASRPPNHYILCPSFGDYYILEIMWKNGKVTATRINQS